MKVRVLIGTLGFEQGIFQKGDIIECDEATAKRFGINVQVIPAFPEMSVIELPTVPFEPKETPKDETTSLSKMPRKKPSS